MLDPIISAKEKLDDLLMLEWALRYYNDLPENNREEKARIESTWFHDLFIAQLIERNETETLSNLFNTLPAQHFSSLTNLIIKHCSQWPAFLANASIPILAANAPQELLQLLNDYLNQVEQGASLDFERILNIYVLADIRIDRSYQSLLNRLGQKILALPEENFGRIFFLPSLLRLSNGLTFDMLESILAAALRSYNSSNNGSNRSAGMLKSLFQGLYGQKEYLELIFDRSKKESEQRLEPLADLFHEETPLVQLDQWLDSPPSPKSFQYWKNFPNNQTAVKPFYSC
ncbi:hypothetical protein [Nitrosomonas communis]|uniref:Uncharacterized protein n=1 Tax=Nitrosomonas communis TaxID=44574 RepID=A0A1I4VW30_9PROT|nr:hypothetical protein [Nitrosomonas communis]SFN05548.1 hypothetical protein SAMN05421863_10926 [Nitrosomonas communis]